MPRRARPSVSSVAWAVCLLSLAGLFAPGFAGHSGVDWEGVGWAVAWCGFPVAGAVIVARRPQNHVGLAMMGTGVALAVGDATDAIVPRDYASTAHHSVLSQIALNVHNWAYAPAYVLIIMVPLLFPQGRFTRRWRIVAWLLGLDLIPLVLALATRARVHVPGDNRSVPNPFHLAIGDRLAGVVPLLTMLIVLTGAAAVIGSAVRYWRSAGVERLQRKWVAFTLVTAAVVFVGALLANTDTRLGSALSLLALTIGISGTGAAITTAILRHHLYDIDRLVSRTVSYAVVTALLVAVYVGLVTLATKALNVRTSLGVATATLAAAALFNPLRGRVQRVVDRRFNRARYDAARVADAFAAHVRDAVTLETVRAELASTVQKTVEPAHVSVWLA
ncbi:MAG TPA: hypothetical protein VFH54_20190 [Mycobacteriales bacterium]|nr:hypothetical protein [Mycobacteriales bacterium]